MAPKKIAISTRKTKLNAFLKYTRALYYGEAADKRYSLLSSQISGLKKRNLFYEDAKIAYKETIALFSKYYDELKKKYDAPNECWLDFILDWRAIGEFDPKIMPGQLLYLMKYQGPRMDKIIKQNIENIEKKEEEMKLHDTIKTELTEFETLYKDRFIKEVEDSESYNLRNWNVDREWKRVFQPFIEKQKAIDNDTKVVGASC